MTPFETQVPDTDVSVSLRARIPEFFAGLEDLRRAPFQVDEGEFVSALRGFRGDGISTLVLNPPSASKDAQREIRWGALLEQARALGGLSGKAKVSVLVPIRDGDRYFLDAVQSVVAQTFTSWEVLFIDDGSRDASTARMTQLAALGGGRFRCLAHPGRQNRGLPASRNLGLSHARGEYVAMLDIDDVWLENKLEKQVRLLEAHPACAMAYGPISYWFGWTGRTEDMRRDFMSPHGRRHDVQLPPPDALRHVILHRDGFPIPSGALVRRATLASSGIRFDESFGMYEDDVFLSQIASRHPVYLHSEVLERYRQHRNSFTAVAERHGDYSPHRSNEARNRFLRWLDAYLERSGCDPDGDLRSLIPGQLESMY